MPHPLIERLLVATAGPDPTEKALDTFWDGVRDVGTPLLQPHPSGDGYIATFLYPVRYERLHTDGNYSRVVVDFDQHAPYRLMDGIVEMEHLPRTNVWHREIHVPHDFHGVYCFNLWDSDGLITEDIHEPWAMSFQDPFNPRDAREYDAVYPRNLLTVGLPPRPESGARGENGRGTVVELTVRATLLDRPRRPRSIDSAEDSTHPVWAYLPTAQSDDAPLPCVVLMNGQFVEHVDMAALLDRAIAEARIPPVMVITSGVRGGNQNAWGWRGSHGPPPFGRFLRHELLPSLLRDFDIRPELHLIAFGTPCVAAMETAAGAPDLFASVTLLCPSTGSPYAPEQLVASLAREAKVPLYLGWPTPRTGLFAWTSASLQSIATARPDARRIPLTDPHIYSAAEAVIEAIGRLVPPAHTEP